jgi:hypothetical protein
LTSAFNTSQLRATPDHRAEVLDSNLHRSNVAREVFGTLKLRWPCHRTKAAQAFIEIHAYGYDQSKLYSDEGPPIGTVAPEAWAEVVLEIEVRVLRRHFFAPGLSAKPRAIPL